MDSAEPTVGDAVVDANILSTPIHSVDSNISVGANILPAPMFCRRQYFVAAYIFDRVQVKDDYLVLMIMFCVYHNYY